MSDTPRTDDTCIHDLSEQETACADGFCPICATIKLIERSGLIYEAKDKIVQLERELAEAKAQRDLAVEALKIIGECFTTEAMFSETATAAMTARMIKKVLKECGK